MVSSREHILEPYLWQIRDTAHPLRSKYRHDGFNYDMMYIVQRRVLQGREQSVDHHSLEVFIGR